MKRKLKLCLTTQNEKYYIYLAFKVREQNKIRKYISLTNLNMP